MEQHRFAQRSNWRAEVVELEALGVTTAVATGTVTLSDSLDFSWTQPNNNPYDTMPSAFLSMRFPRSWGARMSLAAANRAAFSNGGSFLQMHPDFEPQHWTETCAPLVFDGPKLIRAKAAILEVAAQNGHVITAEADVHILADGVRIEPVWLTETRAAFVLPAECANVALR